MNKKISVIFLFAVFGAPMLTSVESVFAQGTGIIGARRDPTDNSPAKPRLLLNREPVPALYMKYEVVEILPGGMNVLGSTNMPGSYNSGSIRYIPGLRVGSNSLAGLRIDGDQFIQIGTDVRQLDKDGIVLDVTIFDGKGNILASQKLPLQNYQEAIIELAKATTGNKRLAVRFLPTVKVIEALQDYPALVQKFGLLGVLLKNDKEVLNTGGGCSDTVEDLRGNKQQFSILRYGSPEPLIISYRPFAGATIAGYFQDRQLMIEWNGDLYWWISLDKPYLPEGRWAAYVMPYPASAQVFLPSCFNADPNDVANQLKQMEKPSSTIRK